jgi:Na+/H+-dicarboxylate symporter
MKKLELHWKILIGMVAGILFGFVMSSFSWGYDFILNWIAPFGTIFIRLRRYKVFFYGEQHQLLYSGVCE